jgi:hypothetical protein
MVRIRPGLDLARRAAAHELDQLGKDLRIRGLARDLEVAPDPLEMRQQLLRTPPALAGRGGGEGSAGRADASDGRRMLRHRHGRGVHELAARLVIDRESSHDPSLGLVWSLLP